MALSGVFSRPAVQMALIGAVGGITPRLIRLLPGLTKEILPGAGQILALVILGFLGCMAVVLMKPANLLKAFVTGAGAPALFGSLLSIPVNADLTARLDLAPVAAAYAQDPAASGSEPLPVTLVVMRNETPTALNTLWLRADGRTLDYRNGGDTLFAALPAGASSLSVRAPQADSIVFTRAELVAARGTVHVALRDNGFLHDLIDGLTGSAGSVTKVNVRKAE